MANFFIDTKNKIQDLFIYLVSCGKSSTEPGNDQQGLVEGHGLVIIPGNAPAGYEPIVLINNEPGNAQDNGPVVPISDDQQGNAHDESQQDYAIFPPGDPRNNLIYETEDAQEKDKEDNTNEQYDGGPVRPQGKAFISKPPGRRIPAKPRTG